MRRNVRSPSGWVPLTVGESVLMGLLCQVLMLPSSGFCADPRGPRAGWVARTNGGVAAIAVSTLDAGSTQDGAHPLPFYELLGGLGPWFAQAFALRSVRSRSKASEKRHAATRPLRSVLVRISWILRARHCSESCKYTPAADSRASEEESEGNGRSPV